MKAKNLRDIEISSSRVGVGLVGDLMRKGTAYDVWALDPATSDAVASGGGGGKASCDQDGFGRMVSSSSSVEGVGAEELNGLSVLLPRKRKGGKLYLGASRSCAFHAFCLAAILKKCYYPLSSKAHHAAPCRLCAPREARKIRGYL